MLSNLLEQHKHGILDEWLCRVLDTYPAETAQLMKNEKDMFANPVAHNIRNNMERILDYLIGGLNEKEVLCNLEQIVKIRAVQDFSPAQAVSFTWLLKEAIFSVLKDSIASKKDWLELDSKVSELTGQAFNLYMACREKIYQIRIKELKSESSDLMRMLKGNVD